MEKIIIEWAWSNIASIPIQAWIALAVVIGLTIPFIVKVVKSWRDLLFSKPELTPLAMDKKPSIDHEVQPHWLITVLDMIGVQVQNVSNDTTMIRDNSIWMHADNENFQRTVHDELKAMKAIIGDLVAQVGLLNKLIRGRNTRR